MGTSFRLLHWKNKVWSHPEWWSIGLCVAAWLLLLSSGHTGSTGSQQLLAHSHHPVTVATSNYFYEAWLMDVIWWVVMIVAMMIPMVVAPIRVAAACSLWARRHRAIAGFLLGYITPWLAFGIMASFVTFVFRTQHWNPQLVAPMAFAAAVFWQVTPLKRRSLLLCHRTYPISPKGWRADRDCWRYGWNVGSWCLVSCWALMVGCMLAGHSLAAMSAASVVGWTERTKPRPDQRILCTIIGLAGAITLVIRR
jgi:predicted metal-binding membrane protein